MHQSHIWVSQIWQFLGSISTLAWRIPGTAGPGGLPSMGSHRVRHDWSDLAAAAVPFQGFPGITGDKEPACQCRRHKRRGFDPWVRKIPWRRAWQPFPVFLAWRIPQTEEPGGLQSMGSQRVRYNWGNLAHTHCHFRAEDSHLIVCYKTGLWGP